MNLTNEHLDSYAFAAFCASLEGPQREKVALWNSKSIQEKTTWKDVAMAVLREAKSDIFSNNTSRFKERISCKQ